MNKFKVICIDNIGSKGKLNIDAIYLAERFYSDSYLIYYDNGKIDIYAKNRFKTINELREERLNKLI